MPTQYPSFTIDRDRHRARLRNRLELLDHGPQLPSFTRPSGLEVETHPRTGATRVRYPGITPWVSID